MTKQEIGELIGITKDHLRRRWWQLKPHVRDELKHKIKLLKKKLKE